MWTNTCYEGLKSSIMEYMNFVGFVILGIESRSLHTVRKYSTTELTGCHLIYYFKGKVSIYEK